MADGPSVHHHVLLERRGGTAKVARMLAASPGSGAGTSLSFEIPESGVFADTLRSFQCDPGDLAALAPAGSVVHVHATRDWQALLAGFRATPGTPGPLIVTAHDCTLITGGCVYPVFCDQHQFGCPDPCPRAYPDSRRARSLIHEAVSSLRPVLVSPSSWLARLLRHEWPDIPVKVIPNGIDAPPQLADKSQSRSRLGISPAAKVVLFLAHGGTKAAYKGGDRFEALFARVAAKVPGALCLLAGGEESLRGEGVMRLPYVDGELLSTVLRAADVLVYPSQADNHPLVVLEAMGHALPVAAYGVGGIPEQIENGVCGRLVPVNDEEGLAEAAAGILSDARLAKVLGENARSRALKHFSAGRMALDYAKLYARLMAKGAA
ncbi:MAG: glycosyltransferase [Desulfovibrio sp.]|nr:glycosyltransferase [Desulfovibrio sp.]MBI4958721.1 glycosyltransferase [Desulfovibrio sp.]